MAAGRRGTFIYYTVTRLAISGGELGGLGGGEGERNSLMARDVLVLLLGNGEERHGGSAHGGLRGCRRVAASTRQERRSIFFLRCIIMLWSTGAGGGRGDEWRLDDRECDGNGAGSCIQVVVVM